MKLAWLAFTAASLAAQHIDLEGTWKWYQGDDPRFADPDFDDSAWSAYELPRRGAVRLGRSWVRRRVTATAAIRNPALTIGAPNNCYEVFVNGTRIGDSGCGPSGAAPVFLPRAFRIPGEVLASSASAVIAIRMEGRPTRMTSAILRPRDPGPYLIANDVHAATAVDRGRLLIWQGTAPAMLNAHTQLVIALLLLILWVSSRDRAELLWFGACLTCFSFSNYSAIRLAFSGGTAGVEVWFVPIGLLFLNFCCHVVLLERPVPPWLTATLVAVILGARALFDAPVVMFVSIVLPLYWSSRRLRRGSDRRHFAAAILTYMVFMINGAASQSIPGWPLPAASYAGPFQVIHVTSISAAVAFVILLLLLRVVGADRREKQRLASELEAARTMQQLQLPASAARSESFEANSVYEPAQEVGGDFHWTRATPDGALLVVVGDVSGKGLKAAMLVSVAIGILRNEKSGSPAAILGALNDGLAGQTGGGFATCCCARFDTDGRVTIANAGHPSPYCDGREVAVDPGLPLGVVAGMEYGESIVRGERFTFVSDGVVEAENTARELFGFERTREISTKPAQEIAEAAKQWGQNDDITVVTVRRNS